MACGLGSRAFGVSVSTGFRYGLGVLGFGASDVHS